MFSFLRGSVAPVPASSGNKMPPGPHTNGTLWQWVTPNRSHQLAWLIWHVRTWSYPLCSSCWGVDPFLRAICGRSIYPFAWYWEQTSKPEVRGSKGGDNWLLSPSNSLTSWVTNKSQFSIALSLLGSMARPSGAMLLFELRSNYSKQWTPSSWTPFFLYFRAGRGSTLDGILTQESSSLARLNTSELRPSSVQRSAIRPTLALQAPHYPG